MTKVVVHLQSPDIPEGTRTSMSTNSTSTNKGAGRPKPAHLDRTGSPVQVRTSLGFHLREFLAGSGNAGRLANEFFLVIPQDLSNGDHEPVHELPTEGETEAIPTTLLTEEMLPLRGTEPIESAPSVPGPFPRRLPVR
jgi:hypothetical protein